MKMKIEKDTVQETLIIPLYGRKMCSELFPRLYAGVSEPRRSFGQRVLPAAG